MTNYIKKLKELNKDSLLEAGGKGANLGELINANLPVPPGFVVTTKAYAAHLLTSDLKEKIVNKLENLKVDNIKEVEEASECISSWIEDASMPDIIQKELGSAYDSLCHEVGNGGKLSVAVRSSATAEDLPTASFAGQHETYLGIHGKEAVFKYVKKCWASLWSPQAITYRISMDFDHLKVDLAVVIQAMIPSEAAGVMFTANPVSGNSDEILISAGYGLGEVVVSGLITPDSFIITKEGNMKEKTIGSKEICIRLTEKGTVTEEVPKSKREVYCIEEKELMQLKTLAQLVEKHYGSYQDTEWALSKGKIYLLQARPITTIISNTEVCTYENLDILGPDDKIIYQGKKAPLAFQSMVEHTPYPHTPLDFACFSHFYSGINASFAEVGLKLPKEKNKPVERESGCVALSYSGPTISAATLWKAPTNLIKSLFVKSQYSVEDFIKEIDTWIKKTEVEVEKIKDARKLAKYIEEAFKDYESFVYKRFSIVGMPSVFTEYKFTKLIKKAVGKEKVQELKETLQRALPFKTALQNKALLKIAYAVAVNGRDSKAYKEELKSFLEEFGDRPSIGMGRMLSPDTWQEKPEMLNDIIEALLCDAAINPEESFKKQEEAYLAARETIKKELTQTEYKKFVEILDKIRNTTIIREESVFYLEKVAGCLHRMALKLGTLLEKEGVIDKAHDVFFIFLEELSLAASGKIKFREKIKKRKSAFEKVYAAHNNGIHWFVSTGSFPIFETKQKKEQEEKETPNSIKGSAASKGVYEGKVCIVKSPSEFKKLRKGDVLVSNYTSPIWTPLFKVAGAAVTEIGSASSHAAIVAREYGIPAVVAIDNVMNILKDGQKIRVDGTKGVITLL
ncbi:PEP/pyruvate-binding domain-containing protein [Clostridium sp. JS66]|uniref:PEP/pyruvate-binding domain-containing protein n=1 Tax=Clostridium sp. JS66 TaxID=3064705 RepID=UPI00298EB29D|nr:PEP/pyruvate-binding domain-containing protein [Clostridium sp. JS66]WPC43435.1 PEP/pyruvate-binding domain-containing protein [Clostridium sp. JS66]